MDTELFKQILSQSPWAMLFVWLLIKTMTRNDEREMRLQEESRRREKELQEENKNREKALQGIISDNQKIMSDLSQKFEVVQTIQEDVKEIKIKLHTGRAINEQVY